MPTKTYQNAQFNLSAVKLADLSADHGYEVAFCGRSNAGKSSALNTISQRKQLARTSKTPGRTQAINVFDLDEQRRLIDLPGYGYAKVSAAIQSRWQKTLGEYLETRDCLRGLILLIDIRHPHTKLDEQMLDWCQHFEVPTHILLTKADKISQQARNKALKQMQQAVLDTPFITAQIFSSTKRIGVEQATAQLDKWFDL